MLLFGFFNFSLRAKMKFLQPIQTIALKYLSATLFVSRTLLFSFCFAVTRKRLCGCLRRVVERKRRRNRWAVRFSMSENYGVRLNISTHLDVRICELSVGV